MEEIEERILEVLKGFAKVDQNKLNMDAKFTSDLGLDSLDTVEVIVALEEEFAITIPDERAETFFTPRDAAIYIEQAMDFVSGDSINHS